MTRKSNFGAQAHDALRDQGRSVPDLARQIHLPVATLKSQMTKWKAGRFQAIPERKLVALIEAITPHRDERARLCWAYLVDLTPEPFRAAVADLLEAADAPATTGLLSNGADLPRKLRAIARAYTRNEEFRRLVDQLARWAERV